VEVRHEQFEPPNEQVRTMNEELARSGQIVDIESRSDFSESQKIVLAKTYDMEIIQFIVPADQDVPKYEAQGEVILHCLEGRVSIVALSEVHDLKAGKLLYLSKNEPFSIQGIEHASLLATIVTAKRGSKVEVIGDD
jgi:quercetin dioxygenase-like cupin family protein